MMIYRIFDEEQKQKSRFILQSESSNFSTLSTPDIKRLAVVWSYYSGKIEGNTYTYPETECLLVDGIASARRYSDARMLKNMYNTFLSVTESINAGENFEINKATICNLHSKLIDDLIHDSGKGKIREHQVLIRGVKYIPPKGEVEIQKLLNELLDKSKKFNNPLEKAIYLHCNIARTQPFIDGNKRTSRLIESIVLMENNLVPIYSTDDKEIKNYRDSLISFYETKDYKPYSNFLLNKQIERIEEISLSSDLTFKDFKEREAKSNRLKV